MDDTKADGDVAALQRRLHSEINPDFFSTNFKPMMQLVSILSAEARGRAGRLDDDEGGAAEGDEDGDLRVFTLEGSVVRLRGLDGRSTVDELRAAVKRRLGADFEDQRLYVDADSSARGGAVLTSDVTVARLDLLNDGASTLGACGVFRDGARFGAVHLRNRYYETLRKQLLVATDAVESLLAAHYDTFNASVSSVEKMATQYGTLKDLNARARAHVSDCREKLGLRKDAPDLALAADPDEAADVHDRVLEHWEKQVEAEEALRLLAILRDKAR